MKLTLDDLHLCELCGAAVILPELHASLHGGPELEGGPLGEIQALLIWLDSLTADEVEDGLGKQIGGLAGGSNRTGDAVVAWFREQLRDLFDAPAQPPSSIPDGGEVPAP